MLSAGRGKSKSESAPMRPVGRADTIHAADRKEKPTMAPTPRSFLSAVVLVAVLVAAAAAADVPNTVYYQVTYADGTVRDLSRVPETQEDIRRVVRIARFEGRDRGYEVLSTDRPLTLINRGRTERHELVWREGAWVAPVDVERQRRAALEAAASRPAPATQPATAPADSPRVGRLEQRLARERGRLEQVEQDISAAEDRLLEARGTEDEPAAREALRSAVGERAEVLRAIRRIEERLADARGARAALPPPQGWVRGYRPARHARPDVGVVRPIDEFGVLPHRVQVWKLPVAHGRRRCHVATAHPEAGAFGAVCYVAYADTDGDGVPDTCIARSPIAVAETPGAWTSWTFTTDRPHVYAGCALLGADTTTYFRRATPPGENWVGIDAGVYVSDGIEYIPQWRSWPYLSNLRIHVLHETDDD
jgi:hypothetical protein